MKAIDVSLMAIFAALYAIGVILLIPISFEIFQVRIIDCLIPLGVVFGWPVIGGVTLGNVVANVFGGLGVIDIIGGTVANLIASTAAYILRKRPFFATWASNISITLIVGSYLAILFHVPVEVGLLGIFLGSIVAINILGYMLILVFTRTGIAESLGFPRKEKNNLTYDSDKVS
ncbi:MAG: QueT transporter family protein [Promethearchaeota archaeon]